MATFKGGLHGLYIQLHLLLPQAPPFSGLTPKSPGITQLRAGNLRVESGKGKDGLGRGELNGAQCHRVPPLKQLQSPGATWQLTTLLTGRLICLLSLCSPSGIQTISAVFLGSKSAPAGKSPPASLWCPLPEQHRASPYRDLASVAPSAFLVQADARPEEIQRMCPASPTDSLQTSMSSQQASLG